jgi:hypothetical protein
VLGRQLVGDPWEVLKTEPPIRLSDPTLGRVNRELSAAGSSEPATADLTGPRTRRLGLYSRRDSGTVALMKHVISPGMRTALSDGAAVAVVATFFWLLLR